MLDPRLVDQGYYQTDKIGHGYVPEYVALARQLPAGTPYPRPPVVVELGVAQGEGISLFRDIFETDYVLGVDRDPAARSRHTDIIRMSQDDPGLPDRLRELLYPWLPWALPHPDDKPPLLDLVVDDASHLPEPTYMAWLNLWPLVQPGGFYVVEDWNHANFIAGQTPWNMIRRSFDETDPAPTVESITVRQGLIIVKKRD